MSADAVNGDPLADLKPNVIYLLGEQWQLLSGLALAGDAKVTALSPSADGKSVLAKVGVKGGEHAVEIYSHGGMPGYRCDCFEVSEAKACMHVIAAFTAYFLAMRGSRFLHNPPPDTYLNQLRTQYQGAPAKAGTQALARHGQEAGIQRPAAEDMESEDNLCVTLACFKEDGGYHWNVLPAYEREGNLEFAGDRPYLLERIGIPAYRAAAAPAAVFLSYLRRNKRPYRPLVAFGKKWFPVKSGAKKPAVLKVALKPHENRILVRYSIKDPSGHMLEAHPLLDNIMLDSKGYLHEIKNPELLDLFALFTISRTPEEFGELQVKYPMCIAPQDFNDGFWFDMDLLAWERSGQLALEGPDVDKAVAAIPVICLTFRSEQDGGYAVALELDYPGFSNTSWPHKGISLFMDRILAPHHHLFGAKRRAQILLRTAIQSIGMKESDFKALMRKTILAGTIPFKTEFLADQARDFLNDFHKASGVMFSHWAFALWQSSGFAGWQHAKVPAAPLMAIELELIRIMLERKSGGANLPVDFYENVDAASLEQNLDALYETCSRLGLGLRVDGKAVRRGKAKFSLQVKRSKSGDWFEMHPRVSVAGQKLSPDDWKMLEAGNALPIGDGMVLLDVSSRQALEKARRLLHARVDAHALREGTIEVPRLAVFEWLDLHRSGFSIELPPRDRDLFESLLRFKKLAPVPVPAGIRADMRDYQRDGLSWIAFLYRHRFGACLADDMGLGKTLQTIAFFAALKDGTVPAHPEAAGRPHLVVAPASLLFNWVKEVERFAPGLTIREYSGKERSFAGGADIWVVTYEIARRDHKIIASQNFHVVVYDEAQAVKNARGARSRTAAAIPASFRLCLTGTPLENHIGEYQTLLNLALPGLFDVLAGAATGRTKTIGADRAVARARPFVLRRTKEAVLEQLPEKTESRVMLELDERQRALYVLEVSRVKAHVSEAYEQMPSARAGIVALSALNRLRQLCVSPALIYPEEEPMSPKINYAASFLAELHEEGHGALVFSQFTRALDILQARLQTDGLPYLRLDGRTPVAQRKARVERFQSGEGPGVFLISLKAGGVGLNLTRANYVLHLDPWWNPAVERQASDRAHRIGQTCRVTVQRLTMRDTVEAKVADLQAEKQALFESVLGTGRESGHGGKLSRMDFAALLD